MRKPEENLIFIIQYIRITAKEREKKTFTKLRINSDKDDLKNNYRGIGMVGVALGEVIDGQNGAGHDCSVRNLLPFRGLI